MGGGAGIMVTCARSRDWMFIYRHNLNTSELLKSRSSYRWKNRLKASGSWVTDRVSKTRGMAIGLHRRVL